MERMDFSSVTFDSLWATLAAALAVVLFGFLFAGRIAGFAAGLLKRVPLIRLAVGRLKLNDPSALTRGVTYAARLALILAACAAGLQILAGHPVIARSIGEGWFALRGLLQMPAVELFVNVALIAFETLLLLRISAWLKTGFQALEVRIRREKDRRLKGFSIQKVQVFTASQLTGFLLGLSRYARYTLNALLAFVYLTGLFSIFPGTRGTVQSALGSLFLSIEHAWSGFLGYIPSLFILMLVILSTRYGLKLIGFLFGEVEKGTITLSGFKAEWSTPTYQLVRFLVIALALVLSFPYLPGSSSPAFQGISVFIGLLFSLGSTSVVANVVSGVVMTYTGAFRVGDRVKISDTVGDVIEKGLLVTRILTIKNEEITIPNGMVMGSHIINYSGVSHAGRLILHATITLGYDISWRLVHETLINAAGRTEGILQDPKPFVLQTGLDDYYVRYEINAYTDCPLQMALTYSMLYQNIQDCCAEAGIEILSPHYASLRDGNASTLPPGHQETGVEAPQFRVHVDGNAK
ncbi:Small-conductance mechanosensitive channel-like protein [Pelodictyon luteolum DSM 273]|uniref:Small-conductance mechanosensitive channel-like protein n=2 Tax=Pelodictyon luteolum TaxID=1100 RepID=Q3B3E1_CHLL3|nr:Small-conductance mechanosensitive channel-like protein [Pelodictyon luteolum DSM 273]